MKELSTIVVRVTLKEGAGGVREIHALAENVVAAAFLRAVSAIENHFCSSAGQASTCN